MEQRRTGVVDRVRSRWAVIGIVLVLFLVAVAAVYAAPRQASDTTATSPAQPVAFSHKTHTDKGIDCLFCHSNAPRAQVASVPSVEKCMGCHQVVTPKDPQAKAEVEKVRDAWERGVPLRWQKMFDQPDFVYFSHRPHIQADVQCETCHGDVGNMDMPKPGYYVNMGFCLDCHRKQAPEKVAKLTDCATCHK